MMHGITILKRGRIFVCTLLCCAVLGLELTAQYNYVDTNLVRRQINATQSDSVRSRLYGILAWEMRFSNQQKAVELADSMLLISSPSKEYVRLAEAYRVKGFVKVVNQDIEGCLQMYELGIQYAKKGKNKYYESAILNLIGGMHQDKGDYDKAIAFFLEAEKAAEESRSSEMIAFTANCMAEAYSDAGRPISFTRPFYEKALREVLPRENWQYAGMIHSNMAKEYMMANRPDSAMLETEASIGYLNKVKRKGYVYATCATDIGEMLTRLKAYKEAEQYLLEAYYILDSLKTKDNKLIVLSALSNLYVESGQYTKAIERGRTLLYLAGLYKSKIFLRNAYKVLSETAEKKGQKDSALLYYKAYKLWNDSIFNENKERTIANAESRMKQTLQAKENEQLKSSNTRLRNNSLLAAGVACILLLAALIIVLANRKIKQKNLVLETQKQLIEKQSAEKDILLREIHHRVKNNLQVVSSLLNLQAASISDQKAVDALMASQKRVKAISLIHQNLYAFDDLSTISFTSYVKELYQDLRQLYNKGNIELICTAATEQLEFDIERSVPLGLILNEVITNALKYAFEGREQGVIHISCSTEADGVLTIQVADNGIGLSIPFENHDSASLGFRIIRELTRQLKGTVSCEVNQGTCFIFRIPQHRLKA
ncbi:tetratricopeptide repeat-containing sensor histidine kinase [Sediminibacterium goheungense]|uniref:histidine kinase n=1 Tax=Sediminibacterium goheungense TaxID=1086393 RepID=A0A4R6IJU0_9BACT|nr:sensor histidine kinase [Sediminibacterium goheungense]TDO22273.1 two-component sensor histidine kinase [Sediminibacterium goheungense]